MQHIKLLSPIPESINVGVFNIKISFHPYTINDLSKVHYTTKDDHDYESRSGLSS